VTILGFEMEVKPREGSPYPQLIKTDKKKTYVVPYFADYVPKRTVPFPAGYLIPDAPEEVVRKLVQHGLLVERLTRPAALEVETFKMKEIKGADRLYQGHRTNQVRGEYVPAKLNFAVGTIFI